MGVCASYGIPHSEFLEWPKSDRDKSLWFHLRTQEACGGCGTRSEDFKDGPNAYVAVIERCRGCELKSKVENTEEFKQGGRGLHVVLKRRRR